MGQYESAYEEFNDRYGLNHDIKAEYVGMKKLGGLDDFTFDTTPTQKIQKAYVAALASVMTTYLTKKTKMEAAKNYDMSDVSLGTFIEDFDKVMKAIRTDEEIENDMTYFHTPFLGMDLDLLANEVWKRIEGLNKPLPEIWAKQIRKGKLSVDQLKAVTNPATDLLNRMGDRYNNAADRDLANVVMAKRAMETAINNRSFFSYLNPFNWAPYRRETNYLKDLTAKIAVYQANGFPVETVAPETNILESVREEFNTYVAERKAAASKAVKAEPVKKPAPAKKTKEATKQISPAKQQKEELKKIAEQKKKEEAKKSAPAPKRKEPETLTEKVQQIKDDRAGLYHDLADKLNNLIEPRHAKKDAPLRMGLWNIQLMPILSIIEDYNKKLEGVQVGTGSGMFTVSYSRGDQSEEEVMREMTEKLFDKVYDISYGILGQQGTHSNVIVSQLITNTLMKELSLVSKNPQKYGKYADNYVVKDPQLLAKIMRVDKVENWIFSATYNELKIDEKALKKEALKKEEPKKEEPKPEEPKPEEPKPEEPKPEEPKPEEPKKEEPKKEEPKPEEPKKEEPKPEEPKKEEPKPEVKQEPQKSEKPRVKMGEYLEDLNEEAVSDEIADELEGVVKFKRSLVVSTLNANARTTMRLIQRYGEKFDDQRAPDNVILDEMVVGLFEQADKLAGILGARGTTKLVATQKIINAIMRLASPAAVDEETYGKYADNYLLKHDELLEKVDYDQSALDEAREELDAYPEKEVVANEPEPVVEEPVVEEPVVEEPKTEETVVEEPVVEDPVVEEPVVEEPKVEKPVVEEPVVEEPKVEKPVVEEPVVEEPVVEEPKVEKNVAEEPVVEEPVVEEPVVEEPVAEETEPRKLEEKENEFLHTVNRPKGKEPKSNIRPPRLVIRERELSNENVIAEVDEDVPEVEETVVQNEEPEYDEELELAFNNIINKDEEARKKAAAEKAQKAQEAKEKARAAQRQALKEQMKEHDRRRASDLKILNIQSKEFNRGAKYKSSISAYPLESIKKELDNAINDETLTEKVMAEITDIFRNGKLCDEEILEDNVEAFFKLAEQIPDQYSGAENNMTKYIWNMYITVSIFLADPDYAINEFPDPETQIIQTQKLTDVLIRNYPPVSRTKEMFDAYSRNYVINNASLLERAFAEVGISDKFEIYGARLTDVGVGGSKHDAPYKGGARISSIRNKLAAVDKELNIPVEFIKKEEPKEIANTSEAEMSEPMREQIVISELSEKVGDQNLSGRVEEKETLAKNNVRE